MKIIILGAT